MMDPILNHPPLRDDAGRSYLLRTRPRWPWRGDRWKKQG